VKKKPLGSRRRTVFCVFQVLFYRFHENKGVGRSLYLPSFDPYRRWQPLNDRSREFGLLALLVYVLNISLSISKGCSICVTPSLSQQHSGIISLYIMGIPPVLTLFRGTHLMEVGLEMFRCWLPITLIRTLAVGFVISCYVHTTISWHFRSLPLFWRYVLTFYNSPSMPYTFSRRSSPSSFIGTFLSQIHINLSHHYLVQFFCAQNIQTWVEASWFLLTNIDELVSVSQNNLKIAIFLVTIEPSPFRLSMSNIFVRVVLHGYAWVSLSFTEGLHVTYLTPFQDLLAVCRNNHLINIINS